MADRTLGEAADVIDTSRPTTFSPYPTGAFPLSGVTDQAIAEANTGYDTDELLDKPYKKLTADEISFLESQGYTLETETTSKQVETGRVYGFYTVSGKWIKSGAGYPIYDTVTTTVYKWKAPEAKIDYAGAVEATGKSGSQYLISIDPTLETLRIAQEQGIPVTYDWDTRQYDFDLTGETLRIAQEQKIPVTYDAKTGTYTIDATGKLFDTYAYRLNLIQSGLSENYVKQLNSIQGRVVSENVDLWSKSGIGSSSAPSKYKSGVFGIGESVFGQMDEFVGKLTKYLPDINTEQNQAMVKKIWESTVIGQQLAVGSKLLDDVAARFSGSGLKGSETAAGVLSGSADLYRGINVGIEAFTSEQYSRAKETPVSYFAETVIANKLIAGVLGAGTKVLEGSASKILAGAGGTLTKAGAGKAGGVLSGLSEYSPMIIRAGIFGTVAGTVGGSAVSAYKEEGVAGAVKSLGESGLALAIGGKEFETGYKLPGKISETYTGLKAGARASTPSLVADYAKIRALDVAAEVPSAISAVSKAPDIVLRKAFSEDTGFISERLDVAYKAPSTKGKTLGEIIGTSGKEMVIERGPGGEVDFKTYTAPGTLEAVGKIGEVNRATMAKRIADTMAGKETKKTYAPASDIEGSVSKVIKDIDTAPGYKGVSKEVIARGKARRAAQEPKEILYPSDYDITDVARIRSLPPEVIQKGGGKSVPTTKRDTLAELYVKNQQMKAELGGKSYREIRDIAQTKAFDTELKNLRYFSEEYMSEPKSTRQLREATESIATREAGYGAFESRISPEFDVELKWLGQEQGRAAETSREISRQKAKARKTEAEQYQLESFAREYMSDTISQARAADENIAKVLSGRQESRASDFFRTEYMSEARTARDIAEAKAFDTRLQELRTEKELEDMAAASARFSESMPGDRGVQYSKLDAMMTEATRIQESILKSSRLEEVAGVRAKARERVLKEREAKAKAKEAAEKAKREDRYELVSPTDITDIARFERVKKIDRSIQGLDYNAKFDTRTWKLKDEYGFLKELGKATKEYSEMDLANSFKSTEDIEFDKALGKLQEREYDQAVEYLKQGRDVRGRKTEESIMKEWDAAEVSLAELGTTTNINEIFAPASRGRAKQLSRQLTGELDLKFEPTTEYAAKKAKGTRKVEPWTPEQNLQRWTDINTERGLMLRQMTESVGKKKTGKTKSGLEKTEEQVKKITGEETERRDVFGAAVKKFRTAGSEPSRVTSTGGTVTTGGRLKLLQEVKLKEPEAKPKTKPKTKEPGAKTKPLESEQIIKDVTGNVQRIETWTPSKNLEKLISGETKQAAAKREKKAAKKKREETIIPEVGKQYTAPFEAGTRASERIISDLEKPRVESRTEPAKKKPRKTTRTQEEVIRVEDVIKPPAIRSPEIKTKTEPGKTTATEKPVTKKKRRVTEPVTYTSQYVDRASEYITTSYPPSTPSIITGRVDLVTEIPGTITETPIRTTPKRPIRTRPTTPSIIDQITKPRTETKPVIKPGTTITEKIIEKIIPGITTKPTTGTESGISTEISSKPISEIITKINTDTSTGIETKVKPITTISETGIPDETIKPATGSIYRRSTATEIYAIRGLDWTPTPKLKQKPRKRETKKEKTEYEKKELRAKNVFGSIEQYNKAIAKVSRTQEKRRKSGKRLSTRSPAPRITSVKLPAVKNINTRSLKIKY